MDSVGRTEVGSCKGNNVCLKLSGFLAMLCVRLALLNGDIRVSLILPTCELTSLAISAQTSCVGLCSVNEWCVCVCVRSV